MKLKFIHTIYLIAVLLGMTVMWGCEDDFNPDMGGVVDGSMTTVPVLINFDAETSIDVTSRAIGAMGPQDGLAIQDINSFWMVIYREDGSLYKKFHIREGGNDVYEHPGEISNINYKDNSDNRLPDEGDLGDDKAGRLEFDLQLPSDRYYIYGVANVADFGSKEINTREQLKNIECRWDSTAIANNSEMFGIFSVGQNRGATDSSPIAVTVKEGKAQLLHCWLRRLASKVTIAFDGSELYDNVEVYIDTIMVRDVAKKCLLGMPNHPGQANPEDPENRLASEQRYNVDNGVYRFGGIQSLQELTAADLQSLSPISYYHVCNSSHMYGGEGSTDGSNPEINKHKHSHTAQALYFYENLQGEGKDKTQSLDGTTIWKPDPIENDLESGWKDGKAYGTYIEVRGFYRCTAPDGNVSSGWIKYRFMLGQDAKCDYNVLRNTHYKVTLKLRGYGNDYDWHIDYKEEEGIFMTSPQFISYLYNKSMYATVKIVGEIEPGTKLKAEILSTTDDPQLTNWGPWGNGKKNENNEIEYPSPIGVTVGTYPLYKYDNLDSRANGPHTSFLSLRKTTKLRIEPSGGNQIQSWQMDINDALNILKEDYEGGNGNGGRSKGSREYEVSSEAAAADNADGSYTVQETSWVKHNDGSAPVANERIFRIPLYTRAKELVTKTGFVGNNPYVAYPRKMIVRFTASIRIPGTTTYEDKHFDLEMIQVRRIVNPKGVWRKAGSNKHFDVTLLRLPEDNALNFKEFASIGKWSAEVVSQSDPVITLSSDPKGSGPGSDQTNVRRIEGEDEHPIKFRINFHGAQSGFAVVRVRYHNYTCEHDIFCMIGKEPVQIDPNKSVWWMPTNVYKFNADGTPVYAESPLQEGSLFRRGSLIAITPDNAPKVDEPHLTTSTDPSFKVLLAGGSTKVTRTWSQCQVENSEAIFKKWTLGTKTDERIADCENDFYSIADLKGNLAFPIKKAYGVLYGEGSEAPVTSRLDAYGYDSETGAEIDKGMRGVFVYNENTAKTIFLPIGKTGHGRRKMAGGWQPGETGKAGTQRYAGRGAYNSAATQNPIFADIYRRPGAIYWCEKYYSDKNDYALKDSNGNFLKDSNGANMFNVIKSSSFDINFYSMGFEGYSNGSISGSNSDACFIRTVKTKLDDK